MDSPGELDSPVLLYCLGSRGPSTSRRRRTGRRLTGARVPHPSSERGSGSIWVLSVALVLGLATSAVVVAGQAATLRHRAHAAADLAALGGAAAAQPGAAALGVPALPTTAVAGTPLGGTALGGRAFDTGVTRGGGLPGAGGPCGAAAAVASADGAHQTTCVVGSDGSVSVQVVVDGVVLGRTVTATGSARAGPVDPP